MLGRLALPGDEDWYVQAPAMAAVKLLLLHRRPARVIFDNLAASDDPVDRFAVAEALLDVARVDPVAAPRDLAELARNGISLQRTRSWKQSPDPDYEAKAADAGIRRRPRR